MNDYNEYYIFLDVSPHSSAADIERSYQALLPDARRQGGFLHYMVEEAYRCLSNPVHRARYTAGTYPRDIRISILRESHQRDGRTQQFDAFPRLRKIHFYQSIYDADDVYVSFELLPNGKYRNTKTGEIVDQI